jgi:rare lipoprotein A
MQPLFYFALGAMSCAAMTATANASTYRIHEAQHAHRAVLKQHHRHTAALPMSRYDHHRSSMVGMASYYGSESGSKSASGARINPSAMTAAHPSLPFGTKVRVTNQSNGRSVVVTINDRGPFVGGRVIDLSSGAAGVIGMKGAGVARVSLEVVR